MEQGGLRANKHHPAGHGLILHDCSNAFNTMKRAAVLKEVAVRASHLDPFTAKRCRDKPADMFFQIDLGERRNNSTAKGVHQGDTPGPTLFRVPVGTCHAKKARII